MVESKIKTIAASGGWLWRPHELASRRTEPARDEAPELGQLPAPGSLVGGKYHIERLIARGGAGIVYAARHTLSGKQVALKWMAPAAGSLRCARERFLREASATARIAHPNIVDIYDVCSDQGSVYLVMEYLRGETLAERLARGPVPATQAIAWLMSAMRAVHAAHLHGVIHRDLKPENIFLCCTDAGEALEPKLLDFGISKLTGTEGRDLSLTWSDTILGTPYYMSPEQIRGAGSVDERADVYALGVILFEVLSGRKPFDADTYNELIVKIMTERPPSLAQLAPQLDPSLVAIVEQAMAHDAHARIASIERLALALESFAGDVSFRKPATNIEQAPAQPAPEHALTLATPSERTGSRFHLWLPLTAVCALVVGFELVTHVSGLPRGVQPRGPAAAASPTALALPSHAPVQLTSEGPAAPALLEVSNAESSATQPHRSDNSAAATDKSQRRAQPHTARPRRSKRAAALQTRVKPARAQHAPVPEGLKLDSRDFR